MTESPIVIYQQGRRTGEKSRKVFMGPKAEGGLQFFLNFHSITKCHDYIIY